MEETVESTLVKAEESLRKGLDHFKEELLKIRAGKATPAMLNGIMVKYYGTPTALSQVANISASDSRTLTIQPWEKSLLGEIEKGIFEANLGLTPMNDGETVRISIPPLTEERRKGLAKQAKAAAEDAKVAMRSIRQKAMDFIKKEIKDGYPEDAGKKREAEVEAMLKNYVAKAESVLEAKEKEILTV